MRTKKQSQPDTGAPPVGLTLAALRQAQALSLDALSRKAGVSKSMLSQIERAQANPTVAVVWRLANALGVPMADLLAAQSAAVAPPITLVEIQATPCLRSADGLCELRILGPVDRAGQFEWYELKLKTGGALESQAHEAGTQEHLSVVCGTLEVRVAHSVQKVRAGETVRYQADDVHCIRNLGKTACSAWLVVIHSG